VLTSNGEKHEVHRGDILVVFSHLFFKDSLEVVHISNGHQRGFVALASRDKAGEDQGLFEDLFGLQVTREVLESGVHEAHVGLNVLREQETIEPDTVALVSPKTSEHERLSLEHVILRVHDVLNNLGEVTQIELVMELASGGHKAGIFTHYIEDIHSSIDDTSIPSLE
jgi:hypothetical protein